MQQIRSQFLNQMLVPDSLAEVVQGIWSRERHAKNTQLKKYVNTLFR